MRALLLAIACVTATVGGCGSGGGSGGGSIPFDQLANEYAKVFCRKGFVCCDAAELQSSAAGADEAACRSLIAADIMSDLAGDQMGVAMGTTVYDGSKARACFDIVAALPCSEWGADERLSRFPDCLQILDGTVAPGGACARTGECRDGTCDISTGSGVCVARSDVGESCATNNCRLGLYCALDASGRPTSCAVPKANGMPCAYESECASHSCVGAPSGLCSAPTLCNGV